MPTAAKLVSALAFALVAFWATVAYIPHLPEGTDAGYLREIMVVLGLIIGWLSMGRNVGRGYMEAVSYGLRGSVLLVFWGLLGFACYIMLLRSTRQIYRADVGKALLDVPNIMMGYGKLLMAQDVLIALGVGGVLAGLAAEWASQRWS